MVNFRLRTIFMSQPGKIRAPVTGNKKVLPGSFKTSSPKGNDHSPESNVPRSICPKTLCSLSPTTVMLNIKFDEDWPTGFRDIEVQVCNFCNSRASNSILSSLIRPKIELDRAFMPVLVVTGNFEDDSIQNERASMETPFSHCRPIWEIF